MVRTIHEAGPEIRQGRLTPVDLVHQCFKQIDRWEQCVKAWVFVDRERTLADAQRLSEEVRGGRYRGPLHGIPMGIKDIFDVFDWPTGCGSKAWSKSYARRDATIVERLRRAGAVFLGKTVTTNFASFDPPVTRNPWNLERTPGGSSSGSAAALACGMCLGALGSQTGGSITRPASYCGVAGLKPSFGLISCDGTMPFAPSLDHPGPMARCIRDLAILLEAIAGTDSRDPNSSFNLIPSYTARLDEEPKLPELGRARGLFEDLAEPAVRKCMQRACAALQARGAKVKEVALPASFQEVLPRHRTIMAVEAAAYHKERLQWHPDDYGPNVRALLEEGLACPAVEYTQCKRHQQLLKLEMSRDLSQLDALLAPA